MSGDIHIRLEPSGPVIEHEPIPTRNPFMNEGFKRLLILGAAIGGAVFLYYQLNDLNDDAAYKRPQRQNERYEDRRSQERYEAREERRPRRSDRPMIAPDGQPYIGWRECPKGVCGELHTTPAPFDSREWHWR